MEIVKFVRRHAAMGWAAALYVLFLYPLFGRKTGFLFGDYGLQFYPWMKVYADGLRAHALPLWTPLIQSGFPLFAEGQTGMLYLPNLVLFSLLPFKAAYNAMFLLHYFLGGLFSYLFARRRRLSPEASALVSLCFTFGSAYAGSFYNIVTLRSLVWFPLLLLFVERFIETRRLRPLAGLAFFMGQSWLAGFPQTSLYLFFFVALYFALRLREENAAGAPKAAALFLAAMAVSILIGLPQLWASLSLAAHSTRLLQKGAFAFWGSVPPWGAAVLFLYSWGNILNVRLYVGVAPLLLALGAPSGREGRVWVALAAVSFLLAMGGFNPLCWLLIKLPVVSLLRNPSKFLFFTEFSLAMLAGLSLDRFASMNDEARGRHFSAAAKWSAGFLGLALAAWAALRLAAPIFIRAGEWYVKRFVVGASHHRGSAEYYLDKVRGVLELARHECSPANPFVWVPFLFAGAFLLLLRDRRAGKGAVVALAALDLFVFGSFNYGSGFIGNLRPFPDAVESVQAAAPRDGKWLDVLPEAEAIFPPNRNLLTGHASAGAYSPLLDKDYFLLLSDLGVLDDAFGRQGVRRLGESRPLLDFLGVRYFSLPVGVLRNESPMGEFASPTRLAYANDEEVALNFIRSEKFDPRTVAVVMGDFQQSTPVAATIGESVSKPMRASVLVDAPGPAILTRNQVYDAGWKVRIDGKPAELQKVNLAFQAVEVPAGAHRVDFVYRPEAFYLGRWFSLAGLALVLLAALAPGRTPRRG